MVFSSPKTGEIESEMCQQSAIKCLDEIYPADRRLQKYHDLMLQNNKTRGRDVSKTYWGGIDSTVQDEN